MEFSRQESWNGLSFPSPGYLPDQGIKPGSPALQADASGDGRIKRYQIGYFCRLRTALTSYPQDPLQAVTEASEHARKYTEEGQCGLLLRSATEKQGLTISAILRLNKEKGKKL